MRKETIKMADNNSNTLISHLKAVQGGKKYFENYIPAAVNSLKRIIGDSLNSEFPLLASIVKKL